MVSFSGTMTKDSTIRITLRLPAKLHSDVVKSADICNESLNAKLVELIEIGLLDDLAGRLLSVPESRWAKTLTAMREESKQRYDSAWESIKQIWAARNLRIKKGAA